MLKKAIHFFNKRFLPMILCACIITTASIAFAADGMQTYQKNVHLSEEHKQRLADDIVRYRNADNLWDVLREEFSLSHYEDHPAVQAKIRWYLNNQEFLARSASRAAPYLYYILQQVKKRHLPAELVLLPIIESGYNPYSLSNMGAAGIWQLMPGTASGLGVKRNGWYDGRRDIIASTRAALSYLAYLQSFFEGNWLYAIAAYNTGEGNVLSAIKRNIRNGEDTDFWSLPVAQQTRDYVPSLLALAIIVSNPDRYQVYLPPVRNAPYLAQVDLGKSISIKYASTLAGVAHKKLMQLNSAYSQTATDQKGPYKIILPIENVEQFTENLSQSRLADHPINWQHYRVKSGDTLASIANKFDVSVGELRQLNQLGSNSVRKGMNLVIPSTGQTQTGSYDDHNETQRDENRNETLAQNTSEPETIPTQKRVTLAPVVAATPVTTTKKPYKLQSGDTVYMTRKHDSLESIAKRFHTSIESLQTANRLQYKKLTPGKQLIIPTHKETVVANKLNKKNAARIAAGDTIYMVRRGDTIEKISKKFHTSQSIIRVANVLNSNTVREGDRLLIPSRTRG